MMILVEYINVLTKGSWLVRHTRSNWSQFLVAALLGLTPGCLGAFLAVSLHVHRELSLGAIVTCMIASSGDEAFVMLALFPAQAALLMLGLAAVGILAGIATDFVFRQPGLFGERHEFELHQPGECRCFERIQIL